MLHPPEKPRHDDLPLERRRIEFEGAELAEAARAWHPGDIEHHLQRQYDPNEDD
jgi:hypothetical protein